MEYLSEPWEALLNNFANKEASNERERIISLLESRKVGYAKAHDMDRLNFLQEIIDIIRNS